MLKAFEHMVGKGENIYLSSASVFNFDWSTVLLSSKELDVECTVCHNLPTESRTENPDNPINQHSTNFYNWHHPRPKPECSDWGPKSAYL